MSLEKAVRLMKQIDQVEELTMLLDARDSARRIYAELQAFYHATADPLYLDYLKIVSKAGESLNDDIRKWGDRQRMRFASADDSHANEGTVDHD